MADHQQVGNHKFITLYLLGSADYNGLSDGSGEPGRGARTPGTLRDE